MNLTNDEYFKLHGTLPLDRIERLLDIEFEYLNLAGIDCHVREIVNQLPDEDFLQEQLTTLRKLSGMLRGENRRLLNTAIADIEEALGAQANSTAYAMSQYEVTIRMAENV